MLCRAENVERFRLEVPRSGSVVFLGVRLDRDTFETRGRAGADVLLLRARDGNAFNLLIDEEVAYVGVHPGVRAMFENTALNGWRPLTVLRSRDPEAVLRGADAVLGLDGLPPRVPGEERPRAAPADEESGAGFTDLVAEARAGRLREPLFRDVETHALVRILSKAEKNAAVLVGPPGVGKTAVVEGLALRVATGQVPPQLKDVQILDVNLSMLAAGATHLNQFEGRVKDILERAKQDRRLILFLDEIHTIRKSGSDASQLVKSDLGRGRFRCIGATTDAEYRSFEADGALARRFQPIPVRELRAAETVEVLMRGAPDLEAHHGVRIPEAMLKVVVDLAVRYVPSRQLPDKALDLLDEACAAAHLAGLPGGAAVPPTRSRQARPNAAVGAAVRAADDAGDLRRARRLRSAFDA